MKYRVRTFLRCVPLIAAIAVSGCNIGLAGGDTANGSSSSDTTTGTSNAKYTISGTISGLSQSGLSLTSSGDTVTVASGATKFALPTPIASGSNYSVTVQSQPPSQTCVVTNGSGTAQANVTNVSVKCTTNTYTIGGLITGLNASGLVLANGAATFNATVGNSAFVFGTMLPMGAAYAVTVQTQPTGLQCQVINGTGTMPAAAITNVVVACGQWTWTSGADTVGAAGTYGMRGSAAPGNVPGAREGSVAWLDSSGMLWLFGGTAANASFNDLWKYDPSSGEWTWVSGSAVTNANGVYGSQGVAAAGNTPGARSGASASSDGAGNLWLFGGQGLDGSGTSGSLNDLWKFNITQGEWTWVSGANTAWASGTMPPNNAPGGRSGAVQWTDATGNVWLFGGAGTQGLTNDLWQFVPMSGTWSLISGSQTPNAPGVYGTLGTAAATNLPGGRTQAAAAIDASGNLWLFGGSGYGAIGGAGLLNDLWQFSPASGQWTWVAGWNTINALGNFGTSSTTAVLVPGARDAAAATPDSMGNLWLFGGTGFGASGAQGALNDAWEYDIAAKQWIWISGSQQTGTAGTYGTLGTGAVGDTPGARSGSVAWSDPAGNLWLFGGDGLDSNRNSGVLNDLWKFVP